MYLMLLYILSLYLMIIISTEYLYKLTGYSFSAIDFQIYMWMNQLHLSITDISRFQNISFGLYMFSAFLLVWLLVRPKKKTGFLLALPILYFIAINDPYTTWILYLGYYSKADNRVLEGIIAFLQISATVLFFAYSLSPIIVLAKYSIRSRIRTKKKDCRLLCLCMILLNAFVYIAFFGGIFSSVNFNHVDLLKFPRTAITGLNTEELFAYSLILIILTIFILIFLFHPFSEWRLITYRELVKNTKLIDNNLKNILHTYKNAFLGIERMTDLTQHFINDHKDKRALVCLDELDHIAASNLNDISHTIEMLKNFRLNLKSIDILACLEDSIHSSFLSEHIDIQRHYETASKESILVYGDYEHLREAFINLLTNADFALKMKHDKHPMLTLTVFCESGLCAVNIKDNGIGIEKKELKNIFNSYYSTKTSGTSFGFGLTYTQAVIRQHKGSITVRSEPGRYTAFQIALPVYTESKIKEWHNAGHTRKGHRYDKMGNL